MVSGVIGFHGSLAVWHVEKGRELGRDYVTIRFLYMVVFPVQVSLWPAISVTRANAQVRESEINCTPRIFFNDQEIEKKTFHWLTYLRSEVKISLWFFLIRRTSETIHPIIPYVLARLSRRLELGFLIKICRHLKFI